MALAPGSRLGPYEVTALIGVGGMGEVYRARDTRLKRDVAIKILPDSFATDPDRLARFQREAEALASLNHPHIAGIYGLEETDTGRALVMELVDGETLADRIGRGPLPLDDALSIARQIAEALEAAHEQGIVHRDLKPANIKITPSGDVKVLDFGLAKALEPGRGSATGASLSPTITSPAMMTGVGILLGTAAYMAPEQARGKPVDRRADIWAFGCVLYEMVTGTRAFEGEEASDVVAAILRGDPDWSRVPPRLHRLLRVCLEKDRRQRLQSIGDYRLLIDDSQTSRGDGRAVSGRLMWWALLALSAWALIASGLVVIGRVSRTSDAVAPEIRLQITPSGTGLTNFSISPDGHNVAFPLITNGASQLWIRPLNSETARPLVQSDAFAHPFWAPDSRAIGFTAAGQLKRVDLADGRIQTLAPRAVAGGAWNGDGTILFTPSFAGPLYRVAATGGAVMAATRVDPPRHTGHVWPQFLPDGRHFVFYAFGSPQGTGAYLGSLDSLDTRRLLDSDGAPIVVPPNSILVPRQGALVAQELDTVTWLPTGQPFTVLPRVAVDYQNGISAASASTGGVIAYRSSPGQRQYTWFDRSGKRLTTIGESDSAQPGIGKLSPDGASLAFTRSVDGHPDVWIMDMARGVLRRVTVDPADDSGPVWSPDGTRVVFASSRIKGNLDLYEKMLNSQEPEKVLLESAQDKGVQDWSPDGHFVLYTAIDAANARDLWALPLSGDRKPLAVAQTSFAEQSGRFSPDGRWVAYQSDESGRNEIYVQAFPSNAGKMQVSTTGGTALSWRGDGRELFYLSADNSVMAVPIALGEKALAIGRAVNLFTLSPGTTYIAASDGQRFLVNSVVEDIPPITILLNWAVVRKSAP